MKEKDFVFNIEKNRNVSCSIAYLKLLYYSVKEKAYISARNCDGDMWKKTQRIDNDLIRNWISTLSKRYGFSYQVKDNDRKGMLIFKFTA